MRGQYRLSIDCERAPNIGAVGAKCDPARIADCPDPGIVTPERIGGDATETSVHIEKRTDLCAPADCLNPSLVLGVDFLDQCLEGFVDRTYFVAG